jgi:diguanylate cyclase (GGDEF)-like protein/PAS domain S-box-containing protein
LIRQFKQYLQQLLVIGVSPSDTEALRLKKISITTVPLIMVPTGIVWALIYYFFDHWESALLPLAYSVISIFNLWRFSKTKNLVVIQKTQMVLVLLVPFMLMWSLGGFALGSYVMIWAFFAPVAALIYDKSSKSLFWFYSFLGLLVFSSIIDPWLIEMHSLPMSQLAINIFTLLNLSMTLSGIYFLIKHFININDRDASKIINNNLSYLQSYKDTIDRNLIVTRTDMDGNITFANENFYKVSGFSKEEVLGKSHNIVRHPDNKPAMFDKLWKTILSKEPWQGRIKNLKKDGSSYWIDTTIAPILNKDNEIVEFIAVRHDITKLLMQQDELRNMLYYDSLTGVQNREALLRDLKNETSVALILINIDRFSQINDLYGEGFGNRVLINFSSFLKNTLGEKSSCEVYRLGGDEFVILSDETNPISVANNLTYLMQKMNENPLKINEEEISLGITIGVSFEKNDALLTTANMALKIAKRESKNIILYTESLSLNAEYENNLKWIKEIKSAIEDDRIVMYFQPIVDNKTNTINKYETLIRLIDKEGEVITPNHFLDIAKKAKLYDKLTKIVIKKSFEAFKNNSYDFSINITIDDILNRNINNYIIETLKEYNISNRVIFEIVETEEIENFEDVENFITMVKSFGCRISIDDFGTGYSNFGYLMRLQADFIKIDGSIIKEIVHNKRSELITSVIVAFAKELNIETIGEYVENKEIHDKLIELSVDKSQGYYFGKPQATLTK